jgi:hypothetical protein
MSERRRNLAVLGLCLAVSLVFAVLLIGNRNDDAFITYRHAQNLLLGRGFVFNPGERLLGTTAPLHGLLIAGLGVLSPLLPLNAVLLSWVSAGALGFLLWRVLCDLERPGAGVIAAVTVLLARFTYEVFPLETVLLAALCWACMWAFLRNRFGWVALLGAAAVVTRADAGLCLIAIFATDLIVRREARKLLVSGVASSALAAVWFGVAWLYYGSPLSNTASAKTGWSGHQWAFVEQLWTRGVSPLFAVEGLAIAAAAFAVYGLVVVLREPRYRLLRALPMWLGLYVLAYTVLRIFWAHHWYYFPIFVGSAVLFAVGAVEGVERLSVRVGTDAKRKSRARGLALGVLGCALFLNVLEIFDFRSTLSTEFYVGGRDELYQRAAKWLRANTSPEASVALAEPGTVAYYSDRRMVDMMGLVTAGIGEHMKAKDARRADIGWTTSAFDPDVVLLTWPIQWTYERTLPEDRRYSLREVIAVEEVEVIVLLYVR